MPKPRSVTKSAMPIEAMLNCFLETINDSYKNAAVCDSLSTALAAAGDGDGGWFVFVRSTITILG